MIDERWRELHPRLIALWLGCCASALSTVAQEADWYVSWGYNRSSYLRSDVHLWGDGPNGAFDVTFEDAAATDMPERFQAKVYFNPTLFTIPQFDVRFAHRIADQTWVSVGWDHMKYKLSDQWLTASGVVAAGDLGDAIDPSATTTLDGEAFWWGEGFNYEHSDGLNFVRAGLERTARLLETERYPNGWIDAFAVVSAGLAVCSTDFTWAGERTKNAQHVSGYGASALLGARFHAGRHLFLQITAQSGGVRLPWVRIQGPDVDAGATQSIGFSERAFALGYRFG